MAVVEYNITKVELITKWDRNIIIFPIICLLYHLYNSIEKVLG